MPIRVSRTTETGQGGSTVPDDFDDTQSYRTRCTLLEEVESTLPNRKPTDSKTYLRWHVTPYDADGVAILDPGTGAPLDVFISSPIQSTWWNQKTGEMGKTREMTHAFLGREVSNEEWDNEIADRLDEVVMGKLAMVSYEIEKTANGFQRLKVLKVRPMRGTAAAAARPMPQAQAIPSRLDD